jgi:hypothetical protein
VRANGAAQLAQAGPMADDADLGVGAVEALSPTRRNNHGARGGADGRAFYNRSMPCRRAALA